MKKSRTIFSDLGIVKAIQCQTDDLETLVSWFVECVVERLFDFLKKNCHTIIIEKEILKIKKFRKS